MCDTIVVILLTSKVVSPTSEKLLLLLLFFVAVPVAKMLFHPKVAQLLWLCSPRRCWAQQARSAAATWGRPPRLASCVPGLRWAFLLLLMWCMVMVEVMFMAAVGRCSSFHPISQGTDTCQGDSGGPLTVAENGEEILRTYRVSQKKRTFRIIILQASSDQKRLNGPARAFWDSLQDDDSESAFFWDTLYISGYILLLKQFL